ncbi:hypothetical protein CBR_g41288 [Chara braunii]|uniref:G domain-containing protein n=1 Tax=Chara braunii TaxID=69332 RepID=A0A388LVE0_CHABU|nr:hypothetical protein CBR_g41288 [Chara braunii]|eukprot:GBG86294.1 hypothetical protein CBR_g41288 [Chara braunii]
MQGKFAGVKEVAEGKGDRGEEKVGGGRGPSGCGIEGRRRSGCQSGWGYRNPMKCRGKNARATGINRETRRGTRGSRGRCSCISFMALTAAHRGWDALHADVGEGDHHRFRRPQVSSAVSFSRCPRTPISSLARARRRGGGVRLSYCTLHHVGIAALGRGSAVRWPLPLLRLGENNEGGGFMGCDISALGKDPVCAGCDGYDSCPNHLFSASSPPPAPLPLLRPRSLLPPHHFHGWTRKTRKMGGRSMAVVPSAVHGDGVGRVVVVTSDSGGGKLQEETRNVLRHAEGVLDADMAYLTRTARLVQWYPGHIAKAERDLKQQLKLVDVVIEVRDARIPLATTHPDIDQWIGGRLKIIVLNRQDMVSSEDRRIWSAYFRQNGEKVFYTDGQHGVGIQQLQKAASGIGKSINSKRKMKGLLPRSVRAAVVGFPNVGKSALINRLLKKRACESAPRPGVTRSVRWIQIGEELDLMDAPGILPMRIADQAAAVRLAICNDIGEASYDVAGVAAIMIEMIRRMSWVRVNAVSDRYKIDAASVSGEELLYRLADRLFGGDIDVAAHRVLKDYRRGALGLFALERPPKPKPL